MEVNEESKLYWNGGIFQARIYDPRGLLEEAGSKAIGILEEFLTVCQKYYFAFNSAITGIRHNRERYGKIMDHADRDISISIGSAFPTMAQSPGQTTIAQMRQGELLESLKEGGEFENSQANALVIVIYHLWDELYRPEIAQAISVKTNQVDCTLMGDIRQVRNLVVHKKAVVPDGFSSKLELLPQIWNLQPGILLITEKMVHSWMEQLNALQLTITESIQRPRCETCGKPL